MLGSISLGHGLGAEEVGCGHRTALCVHSPRPGWIALGNTRALGTCESPGEWGGGGTCEARRGVRLVLVHCHCSADVGGAVSVWESQNER
jgi:hypothetical protein